MTILKKEKLLQFQKILLKIIPIKEENNFFQSQKKNLFYFIIIYAKKLIWQGFFYY